MGILTSILMVLVPVVTVILVRRSRKLPWGPLFLGAGMFIVAQLFKAATALPLLPLVAASPLLIALVSALAPGIWEELTKWLPLKWWTKPTGWNAVLAFGIGYGGFECIYLGQQVLAVLIATARGIALPHMSVIDSMQSINGSPVGILVGLLFVFERVCALAMHTFFATLNAQAIRTRHGVYVLAAMAAHFLIDFGVGLFQNAHLMGLGLLAIEIPIGIVALLCYGYVRRTVQSEWGTADAAVAG